MFDFIRVIHNNISYDIPKSDVAGTNLVTLWAQLDCGCKAFEQARASYRPQVESLINSLTPTTYEPPLGSQWRVIYYNKGY